jgi:hypothetical protein
MTKRLILNTLLVLGMLAAGLYAFREPIRERLYGALTADMFVAADADAFDPGLPVGARLPALHARLDGREITRLDSFMGEHGLLLFANRSVEW